MTKLYLENRFNIEPKGLSLIQHTPKISFTKHVKVERFLIQSENLQIQTQGTSIN